MTEIVRCRDTERERQAETDTQRHRETQRQRWTGTQRHRETERWGRAGLGAHLSKAGARGSLRGPGRRGAALSLHCGVSMLATQTSVSPCGVQPGCVRVLLACAPSTCCQGLSVQTSAGSVLHTNRLSPGNPTLGQFHLGAGGPSRGPSSVGPKPAQRHLQTPLPERTVRNALEPVCAHGCARRETPRPACPQRAAQRAPQHLPTSPCSLDLSPKPTGTKSPPECVHAGPWPQFRACYGLGSPALSPPHSHSQQGQNPKVGEGTSWGPPGTSPRHPTRPSPKATASCLEPRGALPPHRPSPLVQASRQPILTEAQAAQGGGVAGHRLSRAPGCLQPWSDLGTEEHGQWHRWPVWPKRTEANA